MEHQPAFILAPDPPPFPSPSRTVDLSSLEFVLALVALIAIPALIYTFFFSIKCPPSPFSGRSGQHHHHSRSASPSDDGLPSENRPSCKELVSDVKYQKDAHVKEIGIECPVCLSAFADGEEVKQLSVCKHSFHAPCIDLWLNSHSNCPVCRATVGVKRPNNRTTATSSAGSRRQEDLHQGLPDAASLV